MQYKSKCYDPKLFLTKVFFFPILPSPHQNLNKTISINQAYTNLAH